MVFLLLTIAIVVVVGIGVKVMFYLDAQQAKRMKNLHG